jgi:hypothetical protein
MPFAGQGPQIKTLGSDIVREFCFNRNQVIGLQIRFEVNESLDRSQGERGRCVNHAHALTIPAPAVEPGAVTREGAGRVNPTANPPKAHQL